MAEVFPSVAVWQANLTVQISIWIVAWVLGLWILRVRKGALQYAVWLVVLVAVPLFILLSRPMSYVVEQTDFVPRYRLPEISLSISMQDAAISSVPQAGEPLSLPREAGEMEDEDAEVHISGSRLSFWEGMASTLEAKAPVLIGILWSIGVLLMTVRMIVGYRGLLGVLSRAKEIDNSRASSVLADLKAKMGVRRSVKLVESNEIVSPISYGLGHPVILLPSAMIESMSPDTVRSVLIHELAHIRRWDALATLFQRLIESLFFYNPLVWLAANRLTANREHTCDDWVVSLGSNRKEYAMSLLGFMGSPDVSEPQFVGALFGRPCKLAHRITLITKTDRKAVPSPSRRTVGFVVLVAVVGFFLVGSFSCVTRKNVVTQPAPEVQALLDQAEEAMKDGSMGAWRAGQQQALQWVDDALVAAEKLPTEHERKVARMHALTAKGHYMLFSIDQNQQMSLYEQALALARELGDRVMEAQVLMHIALQDHSADHASKIGKYDKAARMFRSIEDQGGEGEVLQFKGGALLIEGRCPEAKQAFVQARPLVIKSKEYAYAWAAVCDAALEFIDHVDQAWVPRSMNAYGWVCAMLQRKDGDLVLVGQPGMGGGSGLGASPLYEAAIMNDFVGASRRSGDTWAKDTRSYGIHPLRTTGTIVSDNEVVTVPAGTFTNCRLIRMETEDTERTMAEEERVRDLNQYHIGVREIWYAPGVGMVKIRVETAKEKRYTCVLKEYTVEEKTQEYLPLSIGNRWVYAREDLDEREYQAENGYQVRYRDDEDIYYLSHYSYVYRTGGSPPPELAQAKVPSRTVEAEHTPQKLPPDTEPSYVIAYARIVKWMDRTSFTARSGECVRVLVGENDAGVRAIQVIPTVRDEVVHFYFEAIDDEGRVVASWTNDNVKSGVHSNSGTQSKLKPEYNIKVGVNPGISDTGEVTVGFKALFAIPPTSEEWDQWHAHSGRKNDEVINDFFKMSRPLQMYYDYHKAPPKSFEAAEVKLLPDAYGEEGDLYRCELYKKGFVFYSCGKDGQYETDDDFVMVFKGNTTTSGARWELHSDRPGGGWLRLQDDESE